MNYEIKKTKNGDLIPVIDHVHLHSMYDPQKEAIQIIERYKDDLDRSNFYLVLGLGFGYHIEELINRIDIERSQVLVIEPNTMLINDFQKFKAFSHQNISICSPIKASEIFEDESFIHFLRKNPVIIKHDLSFELNQKYFKEFLCYRSPKHIEDYSHLLSQYVPQQIKTMKSSSLDEYLNNIKTNSGVTEKTDFALLALESLA